MLTTNASASSVGSLLFSGKKHDVFAEADELVAIAYNVSYTSFIRTKFAVEVRWP